MDTTQPDPTTTEALILSGDGYDIALADHWIERKRHALADAASILTVRDNDQSADAAFQLRQLAAIRIETEKCRKAIKEPVLAVGKRIDAAAKDYLAEIEQEEARLKDLIGRHAAEVARQRAEAERREREAAEEARRAREAADAAHQAAAATQNIADVIAARQADAERTEALAARMDAADATAAARCPEGVRFAWDFEVIDEDKVFMNLRPACEITVKREPVLEWIKALEKQGEDPEALAKPYGIRAFKKPVISTR